jgi:hypothetical protein
MFSHTCCLTSNFTCLRVLLACFPYYFWACFKSFLTWTYFSSCPLTISIASLEWSLCPKWEWLNLSTFGIPFLMLIQTPKSLLPSVLWSYNRTLPSLNVHPNLSNKCSHNSWSIDPFYLAINLWVKWRTKWQFCPHVLKQMFPKACYKFGVPIIHDKLWHPMMFEPHIKEHFCWVDHFSWRQFCQLGKSINYHKDGINSI